MSADRAAVVAVVETRVASENLRRHMLATEAIMRALAERLGEDQDVWGLVGLAHDLDSEETEDDFALHGALAADALRSSASRKRPSMPWRPTTRRRGWSPPSASTSH